VTDTRAVVERYFAAWTTGDIDTAFAQLAPDLAFGGPTARYTSAEAFRPALIGFAKLARSARLVELVIDGERAAMLYDCALPEPVGTIKIAAFFRVVGGKIATYETQFDATQLRVLLARPA
jgi:hypothetical protein